mmetsp:Transcript_15868/g.22599  ORF Transcript_15868/g.22599 Transcript_15868/m.22599 type:complete len:820 (+) Transcript_15868:169-2628(+)|eukprot:CAMPEP_0184865156 /NCGR_PEP_ID=MMETSP0580-20130426/17155_1 /TAXON_ID=1118495 /ORGANISM="Dactyliosolen fragilissimus" /LENGTH=819 /DNA_ID=CAMNT_0027364249 /DNA_START=39 /DNA_END=2498 /DNA_ORIENTATION=+
MESNLRDANILNGAHLGAMDQQPSKRRQKGDSSSLKRLPLRPRQMNVELCPTSNKEKFLNKEKASFSLKAAIKKTDEDHNVLSKNSVKSRQVAVPPALSRLHKSDDTVEIKELRRTPDREGYTVHRYLRGKLLGKGGFAKVYMCTSVDTNRSYAVKVVSKANLVKARAQQKLEAEIKIHRTLRHKFICEYKHYFQDKNNCYIMLELCLNQSMNELIKKRKRLTEPEVKYFLSQLLEAVQYMHSKNVIHRDLKLGNLFLDKNLNIKVGDLGLATKLSSSDEKRKTICGTPNYIAPEVINGDKEKRGHSFEVDIWSMGVICYTLLVGKPPYESKDVKSTYKRILANEYSFPSHVPISDHARDLIYHMLQTRPNKRPSLHDIAKHPFFTHDKTKIPKSLPSCCTHIAPDWQEDSDGFLVPLLADEESRNKQYPNLSSRKKSEINQEKKLVTKLLPPIETSVDNNFKDTNEGKHKKASYPPSVKPNDNLESKEACGSDKEDLANDDTGHNILTHEKPPHPTKLSAQESANVKVYASEVSVEPKHDILEAPTHNQLDCKAGIQSSCNSSDGNHVRCKSNHIDNDMETLELMHERLVKCLEINGICHSESENITANVLYPEKWVTRYVDYTSKYGLGFLFNDGSAGVYFNDSTKAVLAPEGECFIYIERKKVDSDGECILEHNCEEHTLSRYPEKLQKKVTLLKHFRNYLTEQQKRDGNEAILRKEGTSTKMIENSVFLKKWVRTKHAILFRLSNGTVQVIFYDQTEILLSSEGNVVTYVDKQSIRTSKTLQELQNEASSEATKKRLKYVKDILHQLIPSWRTSS